MSFLMWFVRETSALFGTVCNAAGYIPFRWLTSSRPICAHRINRACAPALLTFHARALSRDYHHLAVRHFVFLVLFRTQEPLYRNVFPPEQAGRRRSRADHPSIVSFDCGRVFGHGRRDRCAFTTALRLREPTDRPPPNAGVSVPAQRISLRGRRPSLARESAQVHEDGLKVRQVLG